MPFDLDPLLLELAAFFERHKMHGHLGPLRRYWRERKARQRARATADWDDDFVIEWLATIRAPPFDRVYTVLPRNSPCPKCSGDSKETVGSQVMNTFPGGYKEQCRACGQEWLVLDVLSGAG